MPRLSTEFVALTTRDVEYYLALVALERRARRRRPVGVRELARFLDRSPSGVSVVLRRLVREGYITRTEDGRYSSRRR
jgi:DNA-binding MarR family transcriptional regulator